MRRRPAFLFHGSDRDAGAIEMSAANAERAGVAAFCRFEVRPVEALARPEGPTGLVMVNPPYGDRIGKGGSGGVYRALGGTLAGRFTGRRVGLVTSDLGLARATALPFWLPGRRVLNGDQGHPVPDRSPALIRTPSAAGKVIWPARYPSGGPAHGILTAG